jgi:pimeloyl-ACP methyl ester carboxylesterase
MDFNQFVNQYCSYIAGSITCDRVELSYKGWGKALAIGFLFITLLFYSIHAHSQALTPVTQKFSETSYHSTEHPCASSQERCEGELNVPLDWNDPDSEQITVTFIWIPRSDTTRPSKGTILGNFGGPTAEILMAPLFQYVLGTVLEQQNLLIVDPRGLGKSNPLKCHGLDMTKPETIIECAESIGPQIKHYSTASVVRDMNAIRDALGISKISFYGNSYGTVFAQAFAVRYPQHTAAIYLDSTIPLNMDGWVSEEFNRPTDALNLVCGRSSSCSSIKDSPSSTIERLINFLRDKPDPLVSIRSLRFLIQGANIIGTREVVAAAAAYLEGDSAPLHRLTSGLNDGERLTGPEEAGTLAIICTDAQFPYDRDAPPDERRRQLDYFYETERPFAPFQRSDLPNDNFINWAEDCLYWPTPGENRPLPTDYEPPHVPVFVVTSDFDTYHSEQVTKSINRFPVKSHLHVRFGGHALAMGPWDYSKCVRTKMQSFLSNPNHPPQISSPDKADGCDGENYRAVGSFPKSMGKITPIREDKLPKHERHLIAAAFATVSDVISRRNPFDRIPRSSKENGLRGGIIEWNDKTNTFTLDEVRFVDDLIVSGKVQLDHKQNATAEIHTLDSIGTNRNLIIQWRAFIAEDETTVTGLINDRKFKARIPLH